MIISSRIPLHRLVLSLSDALDFVHRDMADHQQRVAYIAVSMARKMGMKEEKILDVFLAAALHDIGLITVENKMLVTCGKLERVRWHSDAGYEVLHEHRLFSRAAEAVRHHHIEWADGRGAESGGHAVPFASHIIALADAVERTIDRSMLALEQRRKITDFVTGQSGARFHPDCVRAFEVASRTQAFWLDCTCERVFGLLLAMMNWPVLTIDGAAVVDIAEIFGRIVDAMSPWTATHSACVAATAAALGERLGLSPRELISMRSAGYLHDLGKLSVPSAILDKAGKLDPHELAVIHGHTYHTFHILETVGGMTEINEWASFHHERLDGNGYPFHHSAAQLTLGSRIMCVADIFSALTEDRPYRKAVAHDKVISILEKQAANDGLDGRIVETLVKDYDAIYETRWEEQVAYMEKQRRLAEVMGSLEASPV